MASPPSPAAVLRRALRLACPACGRGPVFLRGFERAERCGACTWRLDRDEGHWLGGSEIHMIVTFGLSAALALPLVVLVDLGPAGIAAVLASHLAGSVALYRHSRALFLALDYLADPTMAPPTGGPRDARPDLDLPPAPRPPSPRRKRGRTAIPVSA